PHAAISPCAVARVSPPIVESPRPSKLSPSRVLPRRPTPLGHPRRTGLQLLPARIRGTPPATTPAIVATGSDRTGGSRGRPRDVVRRVGEASSNVLGRQFGEVRQHVLNTHDAREILHHVAHRDALCAHEGLTAPFAGPV